MILDMITDLHIFNHQRKSNFSW